MAYLGTREKSSCWKRTSQRKLMEAEKKAWKIAAKGLDYLESYYVPIEFDQTYPTMCSSTECLSDEDDESTRLMSKITEDVKTNHIMFKDFFKF